MEFRIADTFTDALGRLPAQEQKAVKTSAFDLQMDPSAPGLQMHRIDKSKDPNFWSVRVGRDVRIIVHKTAASLLLAYVDHHDKAYAWAERRRIEAHPRTGVAQIVEVRERVEEIAVPALEGVAEALMHSEPPPLAAAPLFDRLSSDELLSVGVPEDWLGDVSAATEASFFELAAHLPAEASEALLQYAATGVLQAPEPVAAEEAFEAPDALRRFRIVEDVEELQQALDAPWDRWSVFLHPAQRAIVDRAFGGPGSGRGLGWNGAGTVVALHRAARLAQAGPGGARTARYVLEPLARMLENKLTILAGPRADVVPRVTVAPWRRTADELFQLAFGRRPHIAGADLVRAALARAAEGQGVTDVSTQFLFNEWTHVVDAWQIASLDAYAAVPRLGRRNRMGARQRERLWPVFAATHRTLAARGLSTWSGAFASLSEHYARRTLKPFTNIVVDECQDLGVAELRFLAAIAPERADGLFFAGDLGQRIFQQPFSWQALGIDVRGRSHLLKVNYRTSHQIRQKGPIGYCRWGVRDADGLEDDRAATVSVFNGPPPMIVSGGDDRG